MSTILSIRTYGDPVLREPSVPVESITPEILELIDNMLATMRVSHGVGLAAQQVGSTRAICVIEIPEEYDREEGGGERLNPDVPLQMTFINPRLLEVSEETCSMDEGCLSFPDIRGSVTRPWRVVVEYLALDGQTRQSELKGYFARAVQHEMDHLAGDLFIDHFSHVKKLAVHGKLKRLQARTRERL